MKKKLLAFGSLAMITTPIVSVVACSEEEGSENKSDIEKEADKIKDTTSTLKGSEIQTNIAGVEAGATVTADKLGIDASFEISDGFEGEYALVAAGDDYNGTDGLKVKAKVVKTDDKETASKEKEITITPLAEDGASEAPEVEESA